MEFIGRVKKILPLRSGVSQRTGNEWKSLPFIFEFFEHDTDHYSQTVVLETFDTRVIDNLKEGMEVRCGFEHRTREYDGKFYNEMRLYKIESVKRENKPAEPTNGDPSVIVPQPQNNAPQTAKNDADDDLPF